MDSSYSPSRRNYYSTSRQASPAEVKSSIRDIQLEYARALDRIEHLKSEKSNLKAALDRALRNNQAEQEASFVERASEDLKQCHTQKALVKAEQRILDLEEENSELNKIVEGNSFKVTRLQQDLLAYQDKVEKLGHIEVYNQHLQSEMQFLDKEFQSIMKRVDDLDDDKVKAQISKSISTKYSNDYNQTLLKYINYITKTINSLDEKHTIRTRFEELFPPSSSILKLVGNRDYTNLMLKAFKFVADLLVNVSSGPSSPDFSPFSTGETSAKKNRTNGQATPSPLSLASPTNKLVRSGSNISKQSRDAGTPSVKPSVATPSNLPNGLRTPQADSSNPSTRKPSRESHPRGSNMSFGVRDNKNRSKTSSMTMSPSALRNVETPKSFKEPQNSAKLDVNLNEKLNNSQMNRKDLSRNSSFQSVKEDYNDKNAAELELMQRHKDLMEKERELMEKKRELVSKAKELQVKEQFFQEQREWRDNDERDANGVFIDLNCTPIHKASRVEGYESNKHWAREEEPLSAKASSNSRQMRSAKDMSEVLREKSQHLAKVLTRGNSYGEEIQRLEVKGEQEPYLSRTPTDERLKERTPMSSYKSLDVDGSATMKPRAFKGSDTPSRNQYPIYHDQDNDHNNRYGDVDESMLSQNHPEYNRTSKLNNRGYTVQKKVSFDDTGRKVASNKFYEDENDQEYEDQQHHGSYSNHVDNEDERLEEDESQYRSNRPTRRMADPPRGTQYPSFTVSFGRTESIERRSLSPRPEDMSSILDTPLKGRVDHLEQTYDVIKGEEVRKKAVRDRSPQYKIEVEYRTYDRPEVNSAPEYTSRKSSKNC